MVDAVGDRLTTAHMVADVLDVAQACRAGGHVEMLPQNQEAVRIGFEPLPLFRQSCSRSNRS